MEGFAREMYPPHGDRHVHHIFRRRRLVGRKPGERYRPVSRTGRRLRSWVPLLALSFGLLPVFAPAAGAAAETPSLVSAVFDVDVVLVGARDFPKRSELTIDATAEDLGGRATVQTNDEGRVVLGFRVPAGFSGKVDVKATSGTATASTSISIDVPNVVPAPTPGPSEPATPTPPTEPPGGGPSPAPQPSPPGPGGGGGGGAGPDWGTPMLRDDFNGASIDTSKWSVYHSPTAKLFPRSRNSVRVADGELQLIGGVQDGLDVSGGVANKINQFYGRWKARIKVDRGSGYSGVVLLWPKTEKWPTDGEVDIVEVTGGDRQGAIMVVHNGASNQRVLGRVKTDFTQWVTVGVEWTREHLAYYVNGENVFTVKAGNGPNGVSRIPTTSPMHMTLQFDKGCAQTLPCRNASTPAKVVMHVDWAEVYSLPT